MAFLLDRMICIDKLQSYPEAIPGRNDSKQMPYICPLFSCLSSLSDGNGCVVILQEKLCLVATNLFNVFILGLFSFSSTISLSLS